MNWTELKNSAYKGWNDLKNNVYTGWNSIKNSTKPYVDALKPLWNVAKTALPELGLVESGLGALDSAIETLRPTVQGNVPNGNMFM